MAQFPFEARIDPFEAEDGNASYDFGVMRAVHLLG